jgi:hypothetical protein
LEGLLANSKRQGTKQGIIRRYFGFLSYFIFMFLNLVLFQNCKEQGYSINTKIIESEKNLDTGDIKPSEPIIETAEMIKQKLCIDPPAPQIAFKKSDYHFYENRIAFDIDVPNLATDENPYLGVKSVSCRFKHLNDDGSYTSFSNINCILSHEKIMLEFVNEVQPFRQVYFELTAINECGKARTAAAKINSTSRYLQNTPDKLRFVFVVDNSGSNYSGAVTDPDRSKRFNAMNDFKNLFNPDNTNVSLDFIEFGGAVRYYQKSTNIFSMDFTFEMLNLAEFGSSINFFKNDSYINHGTKFSIGLQAAHNVINKNIDQESFLLPATHARNFIFFISDGSPSESDSQAKQNADSIEIWANRYVNTFLNYSNISQHGLSLSTVYYGPNSDVNASDLMYWLAEKGNGKFFNASNNQSIDLQGLISVPAEYIDVNN